MWHKAGNALLATPAGAHMVPCWGSLAPLPRSRVPSSNGFGLAACAMLCFSALLGLPLVLPSWPSSGQRSWGTEARGHARKGASKQGPLQALTGQGSPHRAGGAALCLPRGTGLCHWVWLTTLAGNWQAGIRVRKFLSSLPTSP